MRHSSQADSVRVIGDEDGYHLVIENEDGDEFDFRMDGMLARNLAFDQTIGIRLHWEEGERAAVDVHLEAAYEERFESEEH
jgi:hypothetical protein